MGLHMISEELGTLADEKTVEIMRNETRETTTKRGKGDEASDVDSRRRRWREKLFATYIVSFDVRFYVDKK